MTQEEKAKAYDMALERARDYKNNIVHRELTVGESIMDYVFPELKENEDEQIRKEIIDVIQHTFSETSRGKKKWLAWLEKQGESYTKRDVDDAWLKGMCDAKRELEKQKDTNVFDVPKISIKDAIEVTSRMQYIEDDMKPIAEFIMDYANWDLHKDEWNQPTLTVPLFRVLDALIQRGKPYCECSQNTEKKGEQKPFDYENANIQQKDFAPKVEPKFKVGDWITDGEKVWKIGYIEDDMYIEHHGSISAGGTIESIDKHYHLWTIQDAKDGDVLVNGSNIFIFHFINDTRLMGYCHVNTDDGRFYEDIGKNECFCLIDAIINPATKEQRDLLFQKMKEAGYEWDAEKKELKKIDARENLTLDGDLMQADCMIVERKSSWTKEDDVRLQACIDCLQAESLCGKVDTIMTKWLKSLKDRVQPKQGWSEEDEKMLVDAYVMLGWYKGNNWWTARRIKDWLKALKQRIGG